MSQTKRPMPCGFEEYADKPYLWLYRKFKCTGKQVKRWKTELGLDPSSKQYQRRPVLMLDKDSEKVVDWFPSITDAARSVQGSYPQNIIMALSGKSKTAYGFKWRYADDAP